jgi:hypothetical protein
MTAGGLFLLVFDGHNEAGMILHPGNATYNASFFVSNTEL